MEIINNSKTNSNFLFVDSSISKKNLMDFISTNKNCRVISFDFESADILKKCNIKFECPNANTQQKCQVKNKNNANHIHIKPPRL